MVMARKKARLRSWRVGGGRGRRNYNCMHYLIDAKKKKKNIHRTDRVVRKEK